MLNFTVGPVMSEDSIRAIAGEQIPYFRTPAFSALMLENERRVKEFFGAPEGARAVFLTGSGTASMEAAVINTLTARDRAIVVEGGSFGARFREICEIHGIPHTSIVCEAGKTLRADQLEPFDGKDYTAFLVNLDETSTGVLYDIDLISDFCKRNGLFLIVDSISSFLCDQFDMAKSGVNVVLTGSQKALALAPGLSILVLDREAQRRTEEIKVRSLYFDLNGYFSNMDRGQTPFTPAVGVLLQLHKRLEQIEKSGGVSAEIARTAERARYFRSHLNEFSLTPFADAPSNAVTAVKPAGENAYEIFETLMNEYGIFICPNGGALRNTVFRVGHIGALTQADYDALFAAMRDLKRRGIL